MIIGSPSNNSIFGPATSVYPWTNVAGGCSGTETRLFECPRLPTAVSCTGANPAAVNCSSACKGRVQYDDFDQSNHCSIEIQAYRVHTCNTLHVCLCVKCMCMCSICVFAHAH